MRPEPARRKRERVKDYRPRNQPNAAFVPVALEPVRLRKWVFGFPGYLWPWNTAYLALALATWLWLTPDDGDPEARFEPGWIALVLARNLALGARLLGSFHLRLYVQKAQGNGVQVSMAKWLDTDNPAFLFRNQTIDNMIWTLASARADLDGL